MPAAMSMRVMSVGIVPTGMPMHIRGKPVGM